MHEWRRVPCSCAHLVVNLFVLSRQRLYNLSVFRRHAEAGPRGRLEVQHDNGAKPQVWHLGEEDGRLVEAQVLRCGLKGASAGHLSEHASPAWHSSCDLGPIVQKYSSAHRALILNPARTGEILLVGAMLELGTCKLRVRVYTLCIRYTGRTNYLTSTAYCCY